MRKPVSGLLWHYRAGKRMGAFQYADGTRSRYFDTFDAKSAPAHEWRRLYMKSR